MGIPLSEGYAKGAENFLVIAEASFASGVKYFTIWGMSEDNLKKRSKTEIAILRFLFKKELRKLLESEKLVKNGISMRIIGNGLHMLRDKEAAALAREVEEISGRFTNRRMTLLFGYDGKEDMLSAIKGLHGEKNPHITYEGVKKHLMTPDLPPVDFLIRTGGEPHWSGGFLMWLTGDSELYFPDMYWPAFHPKDLKDAFTEYSSRRSMKGR